MFTSSNTAVRSVMSYNYHITWYGSFLHFSGQMLQVVFTIDYSDIVYEPIRITDSHRLHVMQNACLCICLKVKWHPAIESSHEPTELNRRYHASYNITRREQHGCSVVYRGLNQLSIPAVNDMFRLVSDFHAPGKQDQAFGTINCT